MLLTHSSYILILYLWIDCKCHNDNYYTKCEKAIRVILITNTIELVLWILSNRMLWQPLTKMVNTLSSLTRWESHGDYKRTQQKVPNIFLHYIYYYYYYSKLYISSMSLPYYYYKANIL